MYIKYCTKRVPAGLMSSCLCPLGSVPLGVGTGLGAPVLTESKSRSCLILRIDGDRDELSAEILMLGIYSATKIRMKGMVISKTVKVTITVKFYDKKGMQMRRQYYDMLIDVLNFTSGDIRKHEFWLFYSIICFWSYFRRHRKQRTLSHCATFSVCFVFKNPSTLFFIKPA